MPSDELFAKRIGAVNIPEATEIIGDEEADEIALTPNPLGPIGPPEPINPQPGLEFPLRPRDPVWRPPWRFCFTNLREGCYTITFRRKGVPWWGNYLAGTVRVEKLGRGYRISGDLYRRSFLIFDPGFEVARESLLRLNATDEEGDAGGVIPIYPRRKYFSYLKGTRAQTFKVVPRGSSCSFTLNFDEFFYTHPATGFSGTFPANASRSVRYELSKTSTPDSYSGKAYEGSTELGTVSMRWVSPKFRRANLEVRRLQGAELPPTVGTNNFRSIFADAGWDLTVTTISSAMTKPASLSSQSATSCWSTSNLHRLMQAVPGYDPSVLDSEWKAYLLAVPAQLGCFRGVMFDQSGDLNDIKREGAGTFSHDGFPASDSSNFGTAEGDQMKDQPRAFLRSATHEVGHTFNQIHQSFEGGNDNSIMTTTPSVADFLAAGGQVFPNNISLRFNQTVRRHLIHQPDPYVRPGAMRFVGNAINAPEADQVATVDAIDVNVKAGSNTIRLGEVLPLTWTATNTSDRPVPMPSRLDCKSLNARISVAGPRGNITFLRPVNIDVCASNPNVDLEPGEKRVGEGNIFYGSDGFAFTEPGRHTIDVVVFWEADGAQMMSSGSTDVWVAYPLTEKDNEIASLLLDARVGEAVAHGDTALAEGSAERIAAATKLQRGHPACEQLAKIGLLSKKRAKKKRSSKKAKAKTKRKKTKTRKKKR